MRDTHTTHRSARRISVVTLAGALLVALYAHGADAPAAMIDVSSTSGLGQLVEARMALRGNAYVLTLRGLAGPTQALGTVDHLPRPHDISGTFKPINADGDLRNASGVTIHFDPPLKLESDRLEIELSSRKTPKISQGHREGGVE